jgi:N-acetylglucosaminyldiphosphoundecaprenol N-acetyl-beta-D-mannosaminyltransferase
MQTETTNANALLTDIAGTESPEAAFSAEGIPTADILGFAVANIDMAETVVATAALLERRGARIVTANAEILYHGFRDHRLGELLQSADLIVPDGIGVVKAAAMLGRPVKARVAGVDLLAELAAWAAANRRSIYLLGASKESVDGAAAALATRHPDLIIAGQRDGYFDDREEQEILKEISGKQPDFLFVAMGFPAQDLFFVRNKAALPVGVMMGVGGAFDALSGRVKRAPKWIQRINLEWAYRFAQNPRRLGRIWALPRFILAVRRQSRREAKP